MESTGSGTAVLPKCNVVVVLGAGGIGMAITRRLGSGKQLFISNSSEGSLEISLNVLKGESYLVEGKQLDVSNQSSVEEFAKTAAALGHIETIVHAAGV